MLEAIELRALLAGGAEIDSVCSASMGPNNSKPSPSVATAPAAMCAMSRTTAPTDRIKQAKLRNGVAKCKTMCNKQALTKRDGR